MWPTRDGFLGEACVSTFEEGTETPSTERPVWSEDVWKGLESPQPVVQKLEVNFEESGCSLGSWYLESRRADRGATPGGMGGNRARLLPSQPRNRED